MLRARKPDPVNKRLKLFLFGVAGTGKTTNTIQFPNSYVVDAEKGTDNYTALIEASNSVVFQTTDIGEVIEEVKTLLTVKHEYRTLIIDPITPLYNELLDKCELQVGADFGRHFGLANKTMKRLANLIMNLDMNVIVTAHAKTEYGANLAKLGNTFDGWKQLDYLFDLVIELAKKGKKRFAKVVKTRIETFPDDDVFEWSYGAVKKRYDASTLEREAQTTSFATVAQISELNTLLGVIRLPAGLINKWWNKAGIDRWDDMPADVMSKCIQFVKDKLPANGDAKPMAELESRF